MVDSELFQEYRPELFGIAYRMLGSASEAEDVLQDAFVRYAASPPDALHSPRGYFKTIVTRLCLDQLKSARTTREQYIGPWLPEPVLTVDDTDIQQAAEMHESITMAFLVLLETLTPQERAVFLLHEVFDYEHAEIAETLGLTTANSRQILRRAKERIAEGKARFRPSPKHQREIVERFAAAVQDGEVEQLTDLLAQDISFTADGGGKAVAARKPLVGQAAVMKMIRTIAADARRLAEENPGEVHPHIANINWEPALLAWVGDRLVTVFLLGLSGDKIAAIWTVRNPDKLEYIRRQLLMRSSN